VILQLLTVQKIVTYSDIYHLFREEVAWKNSWKNSSKDQAIRALITRLRKLLRDAFSRAGGPRREGNPIKPPEGRDGGWSLDVDLIAVWYQQWFTEGQES
jgi:hypothetical protein